MSYPTQTPGEAGVGDGGGSGGAGASSSAAPHSDLAQAALALREQVRRALLVATAPGASDAAVGAALRDARDAMERLEQRHNARQVRTL